MTFKQAGQLGGHVRESEHGSLITFWKPLKVEDQDGQPKTIPLLKVYRVFNVDQYEWLHLEPLADTRKVEPIAAATAIVDGMPNPPSIDHDGGDRAYYRPSNDSVHLPAMDTFHSSGEYYSTTFHELAHSTRHESQLNRHGLETSIAPFGSAVYSKEE